MLLEKDGVMKELEALVEKQEATLNDLKEQKVAIENTLNELAQKRINLVAEILSADGKLAGLKEALTIVSQLANKEEKG